MNKVPLTVASHVLSVYDTEKANLRKAGCKKFVAFAKHFPIENYGIEHQNICFDLIELYKGKTNNGCQFTYSIAKKWPNMTLIYLWLLGLLPDYIKENLHIPVDGFIIDALC